MSLSLSMKNNDSSSKILENKQPENPYNNIPD